MANLSQVDCPFVNKVNDADNNKAITTIKEGVNHFSIFKLLEH